MWYYAYNNQPVGPMTEAELRQLLAHGTISQQTLVWREGMSGWQPLGRTELAGMPPILHGPPPRPQAYPGGKVPPTRGEFAPGERVFTFMSKSADLMSDRWLLAIGFALLFGLITFAVQMIPYIGGLIALLLYGAFEVGVLRFWLTYVRRGHAQIDQMFSGFNQFLYALIIYLLMSAIMIIAVFIAIVPGAIIMAWGASSMDHEPNAAFIIGIVVLVIGMIVAMIYLSLVFSQVFYILADDPHAQVFATIQRSYRMMKGNKWRLFRLWLVYFVLAIAAIFTLFIGFIFLVPYMRVCQTAFYESLLAEERQAAGDRRATFSSVQSLG